MARLFTASASPNPGIFQSLSARTLVEALCQIAGPINEVVESGGELTRRRLGLVSQEAVDVDCGPGLP